MFIIILETISIVIKNYTVVPAKMILDSLFASAIILVLLYFIGTWNHRYFKELGVPYVKPVPWFGNMWPLFTKKISVSDYVVMIYKKFCDHK